MNKNELDFENARQGREMPAPSGKTRITIRLDSDVLAWFREQVHASGGGNYQTLINEALREYILNRDQVLEDTLRKVIREELQTISR